MTVGTMALICKLAIVLFVLILLVPVGMIAYALFQFFRYERQCRKHQKNTAEQGAKACEQDFSAYAHLKTNNPQKE